MLHQPSNHFPNPSRSSKCSMLLGWWAFELCFPIFLQLVPVLRSREMPPLPELAFGVFHSTSLKGKRSSNRMGRQHVLRLSLGRLTNSSYGFWEFSWWVDILSSFRMPLKIRSEIPKESQKWEENLLLLKSFCVWYGGQQSLPIANFVNNLLTVLVLSHVKGNNNNASHIDWLGELNELVFGKCLALCLPGIIESTQWKLAKIMLTRERVSRHTGNWY